MLTDTQRLFMGQLRGVSVVNFILECLEKSGKVWMPLFSPEDTSGSSAEKPLHIAQPRAYTLSGSAKAVLWIAISISIALWIGRLS